ncbi:MAG: IS110 family transposase [Chitinophagaceae bacterium]
MNDNQPVVYAGVDTHQDVHVAVVVDTTGGQLACRSFPTSPLGLARLEHWLAGHGRVARVGVEGTGSYGLGLQRVLTRAGHAVVEVNRPNRQLRRARGKSDPVDALAAAQAAMPGHATSIPKSHDGPVEAIRVLRAAARSTREQMTRLEAQIHHLAVTAPDAIRTDLLPRTSRQRAARAAGYRLTGDPAEPATATKTALRTLARQWQHLNTDHHDLTTQLRHLTAQVNPALLALPGVGPDVAAALLVAAGDNPERIHSSAAFAALCGVNPIDASSGKTSGHRLNRGGNRAANAALHRILLVRMSHRHPATMAYLARRTADGKPKRAAMRCLKRYLAREIYQTLLHPEPVITGDELRQKRQALGLPLRAAAQACHRPITAIARLETGIVHDTDLADRYQKWLDTAAPAS